MKPIGVGIIGGSTRSGWAAHSHLPALRAIPAFRIVAVSTSRIDSARQSAADLGIDASFADHRELIGLPSVELVVVSVKVPYHRELVLSAVEAGKNVLCEWPLGNGLDEAIELASAARSRGVRGWVGLQARAASVIHRLRGLLDEGYVGRVLSSTLTGAGMHWANRVDASQRYLMDRKNGATLLSVACGHALDAVCHVLGEFSELSALLSIREPLVQIGKTGEEFSKTSMDQVAVAGTLSNGITASFHYGARASVAENFRWSILGTDGELLLTAASGQAQLADITLSGAQRGEKSLSEIALLPRDRWVSDDLRGPSVNVAQAYVRLATDIRSGSATVPQFEDAVVRHRMLKAIEQSDAHGTRQSYRAGGAILAIGS